MQSLVSYVATAAASRTHADKSQQRYSNKRMLDNALRDKTKDPQVWSLILDIYMIL